MLRAATAGVRLAPSYARSSIVRLEDVTVVRVLLVDDQETYLRAMTAVVGETPGFRVVGRATSGEEALERAESLQPDLVLLDVNLPGIDGLETTRRLRTLQPSVVVLLLSTYDDEAGESFVAESGAAGYVTKAAFGPDRLAAAWAGS
jgi:DNA-binding NarL/FixJ family response regulator